MAEGKITRRGGGVNVKDATATENDVLQGETFYSVDKDIKTGNIPSKSAETFTPTTSNQTISSGQYLTGTQTILGDSDLVPSNIRDGTTIFGVTGTLEAGPQTYLSFDGVDDYVELQNSSNLVPNGDFTIEFYVNISSISSGEKTLISQRATDWSISMLDGELLLYNETLSPNVWFTGYTFPVNQDTHVALTRSGNIFTFYINGTSIGTHTASGTYNNNTNSIYLMAHYRPQNNDFTPGRFNHGSVNDLRFWNYARTQSQIDNEKNFKLVGNESGLLAYYDFTEGTGTVLNDLVGNRDGTIVGATWEQG